MAILEEIDRILAGTSSKKRLDLIHFLRIKYRKELIKLSAQSFKRYGEKIESREGIQCPEGGPQERPEQNPCAARV